MWNNIKVDNFDLIIDDGLHSFDAAVTLFNNSFSKLISVFRYIGFAKAAFSQRLYDFIAVMEDNSCL
jgi:hypothetical protein